MSKDRAKDNLVVYRGPYDALEIGDKRLERDGEPVALTAKELEALARVPVCHYERGGEVERQEPEPAAPERPPEEVAADSLTRHRAGEEE